MQEDLENTIQNYINPWRLQTDCLRIDRLAGSPMVDFRHCNLMAFTNYKVNGVWDNGPSEWPFWYIYSDDPLTQHTARR
jgi:hypothetical protein